MAGATFKGPDEQDAREAIRYEIKNLSRVTQGDLLLIGQTYRARIRKRTLAGMDANGAPFAPYSIRGPYYFYPNREVAGARGPRATDASQAARKTAARNRFSATGRAGIRTPYGIRYDSYAAAKAAHGAIAVNLYGMEQHTHMLDTMMVRCGGAELDTSMDGLGGDEMDAFENNVDAQELAIGFYGPEAERARGNDEGTDTSPAREFFALSSEDLLIGEQIVARRIEDRVKAGANDSRAPMNVSNVQQGPITDEDIGF